MSADIFRDGHDLLAARVRWRRAGKSRWQEAPLTPLINDRWEGSLTATDTGRHEFVIEAWRDRFATWRHDVEIKAAAGDDLELELEEGARILESLAPQGPGAGPGPGGRGGGRPAADGLHAAGAAQRRPRRPGGLAGGRGAGCGRDLDPGTPAVGRPAARWLRRLVRAVPPLRGWLRRRGEAARGDRGHGLRRRLPAAHPPRRRDEPQGGRTTRSTRDRATPAAHGRSARPRAGTRRSPRSWARSRSSGGSAPRPPIAAWRWRSTTRCSVRPIIPGSRSIRSGSGSVPTAASATRRTRPRSTRTSIR